MPPARKLEYQSVWDQNAVLTAFAEAGVKPLHAVKLWSHLLRNPTATWNDVPDLPKAAAQLLDAKFQRSTSKVVSAQRSSNGETTKLLVELQGGMQVESVIMHYDTTGRYASDQDMEDEAPCSSSASVVSSAPGRGHRRATLCVSSQVGCQMGCTFCATGTMGLKGNLTAGEIVEQLVHANTVSRVRNIVFMGMGEPLNNYDPVKNAIAMMTDPRLFGLSRKHVTVSTVGVIPRLKQMAEELPGVSLALSLHAPNQALRAQIVPSARAYPLHKLMATVKEYEEKSGLRVFVEYVMLAGVNDGVEQAHELGQLLQGHSVVVNLIPWNPVHSAEGGPVLFNAPSDAAVAQFQALLKVEYHLPTTVRQEKGQDISGACGQLVIEQGQKQATATNASDCCSKDAKQGATGSLRDIEELGKTS